MRGLRDRRAWRSSQEHHCCLRLGCPAAGSGRGGCRAILAKCAQPVSGDHLKPSPVLQVLIVQTCVISAGKVGAIAGSGAFGAMSKSLTAKGAELKPGSRTNK